MKSIVVATCVAAFLGVRYMIQLPYSAAICFFIVLAVFAYLSYIRRLRVGSYIAFFGFLVLSAILGGYHADLSGTSGTILPELIVGSIGILLILFAELRPLRRR